MEHKGVTVLSNGIPFHTFADAETALGFISANGARSIVFTTRESSGRILYEQHIPATLPNMEIANDS
jgi:hypothetical protein